MVQLWTPEHEEGAIRVVHAVFDEYGFTWDPDDYHADLYDVPGTYLAYGLPFFVAVLDGAVVGTVALGLFPTLEGPHGVPRAVDGKVRVAGTDCSLERLYVHPGARRQGVGATLFETVIRAARDGGRQTMEIWSDKRFSDAHRLYQRHGARVVGDRICDDPDESPECGLVLDLSAKDQFGSVS